MSGGHFNYMQYHIRYIADSVEEEISGHDIDDEEELLYYKQQHDKEWIDDETFEYIKERHRTNTRRKRTQHSKKGISFSE